MSGIVGLWRKKPGPVGREVLEMVHALQHRGPDSTGVALFTRPLPRQWKVWLSVDSEGEESAEATSIAVRAAVAGAGGRVRQLTRAESGIRLLISYSGELGALARSLDSVLGVRLVSLGHSLEIVRTAGGARDLAGDPWIMESAVTHAVGQVRLVPERDPEAAGVPPFCAGDAGDIAVVHDGHLANGHRLRRRLEARGCLVRTDQDGDVIAAYFADQIRRGVALDEALRRALTDWDGTFSVLVATPRGLGYVRDRLAERPLLLVERQGVVALASEESALQEIFDEEKLDAVEPLPGTVRLWSN